MKIAVIGAGAMGSMYGSWLSQKNEIIFIDVNKETIDNINNKGVTIKYEDKEIVYSNVKGFLSGEYKEKADLVIVFVKSNYTKDAMEQNKDIIGDKTIVMTLQNGYGNDEIISQYVPEERILLGICRHNAVMLSPANIKYGGGKYTAIGSTSGNMALAESIKSLMEESGTETIIDEDIKRAIWWKLFANMTINPITALFGTKIGYVIDNPNAWEVTKNIISEGVEVAKMDGVEFDLSEAFESASFSCKIAHDGYTSMYQDVKKKIPTEIDAINGAVVKLGEKFGIDVPYNRMMVDMIHMLESTYFMEKEEN